MNETEAVEAARRYVAGIEDKLDPNDGKLRLSGREWSADRFAGGWLLQPQGEDLRWRTGVVCLMVMDDGQIHRESSSRPPQALMDAYAVAGGDTETSDG